MASNFNDTTPAAPGGNVNVKWQTDGAGNDSAYVPSVSGGGTNVQTANYTILTGDAGKNIVANSGSAITFKLPASSPSASFSVFVENIGAGTLTLDPNGPNLDGSASTLALKTNQGCYVSTDNTNYFSERGIGFSNPMTTTGDLILGGSSGTPTRLGIGTSTQVLTVSGGTAVWAPASGGGSPSGSSGDLQLNNSGAFGTATDIIGGSAININSGVLNLTGGIGLTVTNGPVLFNVGAAGNIVLRTNGVIQIDSNGGNVLIGTTFSSGVTLGGASSNIAFYGGTRTAQATITGSRAGNAALASLLTALATFGLIVDSTTP